MSRSAFQNFTDPDTFQAAFHDMRAKSFITGRGNFRANFTTIQLDRLSLQGAEETLPRTAFSGLDPRKFAIGFATHPRQQLYVNGLEVVPGAIIVLRGKTDWRRSAPRFPSIAVTTSRREYAEVPFTRSSKCTSPSGSKYSRPN